MVRTAESAAEFTRLHRMFVIHLGIGTGLAWSVALVAAIQAPWVRNLAFLIDPNSGFPQSTWAYLFTFPIILLVGWVTVYSGKELLFRMRLLRNQLAEFALAGAVMLILFYASVDRAVAALRIGWI